MNELSPTSVGGVVDERRGGTSASNAYADALCPGRHLAQRGRPDIKTDDADFGTAIHLALATGDTSKLDAQQLNIYEQCEEITNKLVQDHFGPQAATAKRFIEERFWCKVDKQWEHSAKPDLVIRSEDKALIIEYKTLPGAVLPADRNSQLRDQVVLVGRTLMVKNVAGAIVQPLVTMSPQVVQYDEASMSIAERELFDRVRGSNDPNSPRNAGRHQCAFCRAKVDCKEYLTMVSLAAPTKPLHELAAIAVANWTPMQRAQAAEQMAIANKWLAEVKEQLKKMITGDPESVPGWYLEEGSVKKPVNDIATLHERFIALGGTTADLLACTEIGKGDFEVKVREVTKLKGKALKAKIESLLEGITENKQDAPSLARKKDV